MPAQELLCIRWKIKEYMDTTNRETGDNVRQIANRQPKAASGNVAYKHPFWQAVVDLNAALRGYDRKRFTLALLCSTRNAPVYQETPDQFPIAYYPIIENNKPKPDPDTSGQLSTIRLKLAALAAAVDDMTECGDLAEGKQEAGYLINELL